MRRFLRFPRLFIAFYGLVSVIVLSTRTATATPQFARETHLSCSACHTSVPQLNTFGQRFYANGFRLTADEHHAKPKESSGKLAQKASHDWTVPAWVDIEAEGEGGRSFGRSVPVSWDCTLVASFGYVEPLGLLYHAEYLPVDQNTFIYGIRPFGDHFSVAAGQLEMISQYDPLLDVSPSTPRYLSPNGTGPTGIGNIFGPFAPAGTAYATRAVWSPEKGNALPYSDGWKVAATIPFSEEVAYGTAQPKWTGSPDGTFFETYYRQGLSSYGVNSFFGKDGRHYYGLLLQRKVGPVIFEGGAAYDQYAFGRSNLASASVEWPISWNKALALRIDDQDGLIAYTPTLSFLVGGRHSAFRLVLESEFTRAGDPVTSVTADIKF